jgi:nitroreductase
MSHRIADYEIEKLLLERWSPRAMSGQGIDHQDFLRLLEAARWAPSSYNNQPWRFVYAHRNTIHWRLLFDLLVPFNQEWAVKAAVLVVIISKKNFDFNGKFSRTHSFDTGAAWQNMALQGHSMGLVVHGMEGFDYEKARIKLNIPDDYAVEAMCAIGKPGSKGDLSPALQEREVLSGRKSVKEVAFEGTFSQ